MEKKLIVLFLLVFVSLAICGCSSKLYFIVCPTEIAPEKTSESALIRLRERLVAYWAIAVEKDSNSNIIPARHYRYKHDRFLFGSKIGEDDNISFRDPTSILNKIIIDTPGTEKAIAIRKDYDESWRIYWLTEKDVENLKTAGENGVLYLPHYDSLPKFDGPFCHSRPYNENQDASGFSYSVKFMNLGKDKISVLPFKLNEFEESKVSSDIIVIHSNGSVVQRYFCSKPNEKASFKWYNDTLHEKNNTDVLFDIPSEFSSKNGRAIIFQIDARKKQVKVKYEIYDEKTGQSYIK